MGCSLSICAYLFIYPSIYLSYLSAVSIYLWPFKSFPLEPVNLLKLVPMTEVTKLKLLVTDCKNFKIISECSPTMEQK